MAEEVMAIKESALGKAFDEGRMNIPQPAAIKEGGPILPYCLVGDEAFPLKSYLLRPYPRKGRLTPEQNIYNYRLSRARRIIENTFGIIASQWRIYRKPIIASPENAKLMIQATVCLHNWLRRQLNQVLGELSFKVDVLSEKSQTADQTRVQKKI